MPRRNRKQSEAEESFEAAFKELFVPAYRVARRILGDPGAAEDIAAALAGALQRLPARQREVVVLRHLAGLSEPEVAVRLGVSLGTVKTHLRRGHEALRGRLRRDEWDAADAG
jgi:DNA-directed RNA polymerase specialized sigma24 family protein